MKYFEEHPINEWPIREFERLAGITLPDVIGPAKEVDADVAAIRQSINDVQSVVESLTGVSGDLAAFKSSYHWESAAAKSFLDYLDFLETGLRWILAALVLLLAGLVMLLSLIVLVLAHVLDIIAKILNWLLAAIVALFLATAIWQAPGRKGYKEDLIRDAWKYLLSGRRGIIGGGSFLGANVGFLMAILGGLLDKLADYLKDLAKRLVTEAPQNRSPHPRSPIDM